MDGVEYPHRDITESIISAAMKVHTALGPGLLESCYEACLAHELVKRGHGVRRQVDVPIVYDGERVNTGFRIDLLIDGAVVVELKAVEKFSPIDEAQLHMYLKLSGNRVGLLINFNVVHLRDGLKRRVL